MTTAVVPTNRERLMREDDFIVSKTDTKGIIEYGNRTFIEFSGYSEKELIGANHNIIRHPDMPRAVFQLLWDTLAQKKEIFAYVKNMSKNGDFYWVFANVTPSYDEKGNVIGYYSVRRCPRQSAVQTISGVYNILLNEERKYPSNERKQAIKASTNILLNFLSEKGTTYEELILSI
ncbi:MAG: PAS domain-containing protein [Candidatus Kapaibacterium sp.]